MPGFNLTRFLLQVLVSILFKSLPIAYILRSNRLAKKLRSFSKDGIYGKYGLFSEYQLRDALIKKFKDGGLKGARMMLFV